MEMFFVESVDVWLKWQIDGQWSEKKLVGSQRLMLIWDRMTINKHELAFKLDGGFLCFILRIQVYSHFVSVTIIRVYHSIGKYIDILR